MACPPGTTHSCVLCGSADSDLRSSECPEAKIVYFIRHGESEANRRTDSLLPNSELSPLGRQQATALCGIMARERVEMVISSPLIRAIHTAQLAFNGSLIDHKIDPYWREIEDGLPPNSRGVPGRKIEPSLGSTFGLGSTHPQYDIAQVRHIDSGGHEYWQPEQEAADRLTWSARIREGVLRRALPSLLMQAVGHRVVAVVTHSRTLIALLGVKTLAHCEVLRVCIRAARVPGESGKWILTTKSPVTGMWERVGPAREW